MPCFDSSALATVSALPKVLPLGACDHLADSLPLKPLFESSCLISASNSAGNEKPGRRPVSCLYLATTLVPFEVIWSPHRMRRLAQIKTGAENKRHTNAHRPLTSLSPTRAIIP